MTTLGKRITLRRAIAGLAIAFGVAVSSFAEISPADAAPLCTAFGEGTAGLDNWGPCTGAPNIVVTTSNVSSIGGAGDYHLHLRDTSGPSAACSKDDKYLGDWNAKMGGCGQFCFDFKVFKSGTPPGPITPSFTIWGPSGLRATFVANFTVTTNDPWKQHICAPINLIQAGEHLPSGASGEWRIAPGGNAYSADWNTIVTGVTMVQLPIDFTSDPSEEAGYDNFCMNPQDCEKPKPPPELTGCVKDSKVAVKCNPDGTYMLTVSTPGTPGDDITLTSLTPGVTVGDSLQSWSATTVWTLIGATPGQAVTLSATTTDIGGGSVKGADLCCTGTIKVVMPDCPKPTPIDVKIEKTGELVKSEESPIPGVSDLTYTLAVTNVGGSFSGAGAIAVTDAPPAGVTFSSVSAVVATDWNCGIVAGAVRCLYIGMGPSAPGELLGTITVTGAAHDIEKWENCASVEIDPKTGTDDNLADNRDCVTLTAEEHKVDLGIEKTGGTSPAQQVKDYAFHLTVTNVGDALTGAGVITVTDIVPAGMTFNSAAGTDWTCDAPPPIPQNGMLTCTYTGAGPSAGQVLPTINIQAIANGSPPFHPFNNCAAVQPAASSGVVDWNPMNDNDCVTVAKPPLLVCNPGTTKSSAGTCVCRFQNMTRTSPTTCACRKGYKLVAGKGCVAEIVCKAPLVLNKAQTACNCPGRLVWNGKTCVSKPASRPVPNAPVKPGLLECPPPTVLNKARTACVLPFPVFELPDLAPNGKPTPQPGDGAGKRLTK